MFLWIKILRNITKMVSLANYYISALDQILDQIFLISTLICWRLYKSFDRNKLLIIIYLRLYFNNSLYPSLSAKHNEKSRQACLNAIFLLCFASPRRRRGGMCERSEQIPESEQNPDRPNKKRQPEGCLNHI